MEMEDLVMPSFLRARPRNRFEYRRDMTYGTDDYDYEHRFAEDEHEL